MKLLDYVAAHAYAQVPTTIPSSSGDSGSNALNGNLFKNIASKFNFTSSNNNQGINSVFTLVISILNWFLVVVAIIAFVYLILYGVKYITSGGDAGKATEARNGIINAIIGIIVIALAFFIINVALGIGNNIGNNNGTL